MIRTLAAALVASTLVLPRASSAQNPADPGSLSLAASLFTDDVGSVIGVWYLAGSRLNLGLEVEANRSRSEEMVRTPGTQSDGLATSSTWTVGPVVKWYGRSTGPVVPYLRAKAAWGREDDELEILDEVESEGEATRLLISGALGAEWFPISNLSIGAHAGVLWQRREVESRNGQVERDRTDTNWATFRSGIELFYYFH